MSGKLVTVLVIVTLLGGVIMSANAHAKTLRIEGIPGTAIYANDTKVGEIPQTGTFFLYLESPTTLRFEKAGYISVVAPAGVTELGYDTPGVGEYTYHVPRLQPVPEPTSTVTPTPESIPEPTVYPTVPPLPEGYKSPAQRLTELENKTAEHEQRLTWLERVMEKITDFLRGLGYKG